MLYGSHLLRTGDKIGVVACSDALHLDGNVQEYPDCLFEEARKNILSMGFECVFGENVSSPDPQKRALDFNCMLSNPEISAIMFTTGGDSVLQVIPYLDLDALRKNPKIIVGQSDISVLLNYIYFKTGLVSYHGNNFMFGFGKNVYELDFLEFKKAFVRGEIDVINIDSGFEILRSGLAEEVLIGGNLQCFLKLFELDCSLNFENKILFLETFMTTELEARKYLKQLEQNSVFDKISGLVIGYNYGMQSLFKDDMPLEQIALEMFKEHAFPIVKVENFGHCTANVIIPIGVRSMLDTKSGTWKVIKF